MKYNRIGCRVGEGVRVEMDIGTYTTSNKMELKYDPCMIGMSKYHTS